MSLRNVNFKAMATIVPSLSLQKLIKMNSLGVFVFITKSRLLMSFVHHNFLTKIRISQKTSAISLAVPSPSIIL